MRKTRIAVKTGVVGKTHAESTECVLLPPSGKFRNSGILEPGGLWTFRGSESLPKPVRSSLRSIFERVEKEGGANMQTPTTEKGGTTRPIRYGSVCSGIEAATVAWKPLGWQAQWFAETEPFPCAVLQHHYPNVPNLGDMRKVYDKAEFVQNDIDLLVGGTPCQPNSFAGKRLGLADPRGQLAMEFLQIAKVKRPRWLFWENVFGVLSTNGGRDFGAFLWRIRELGYSFAYRVLDAQFFGVPQRRRRVFLLGYLDDWRPPILALFEPEDFWRELEPRDRKPKQSLTEFMKICPDSDLPVVVDVFNGVVERHGSPTVTANTHGKTNIGPKILDRHGIRPPTPIECERLMGFSDGYTLVVYHCHNNEKLANRRIESLGNSMAVPVMRWIGDGIAAFEEGLPSWKALPADWRRQAEGGVEPVERKA